MPLESDIDALAGWFDEVFDEIGLDMPARQGGTVGEAMIEVGIDGIQARARVQQGPDGETWDDNTEAVREEKEKLYGYTPPNVRTDQMLSRESLKGTPQIGKEEALWPYGTGQPSPKGKTRHDQTITDIKKAQLAHGEAGYRGQSKQGIIRAFFGLDAEDADNMLIEAEDGVAFLFERKATAP